MKRWLAALLVGAVLFSATAAQAQVFKTMALKWRNQNASNYGSSSGRDTTYKQIKVGATDTTAAFSTEGFYFPANATAADSVVFAQLVIGTDSTAAGSFTATSFTITPQYGIPTGASGGQDVNWTSGAAITFTDVTANDLMFKVPLYVVGNTTRGLLNAAGWPAPRMRYLIVAIGGVVSPARACIMYLQQPPR